MNEFKKNILRAPLSALADLTHIRRAGKKKMLFCGSQGGDS
jgi:hypothetical protein